MRNVVVRVVLRNYSSHAVQLVICSNYTGSLSSPEHPSRWLASHAKYFLSLCICGPYSIMTHLTGLSSLYFTLSQPTRWAISGFHLANEPLATSQLKHGTVFPLTLETFTLTYLVKQFRRSSSLATAGASDSAFNIHIVRLINVCVFIMPLRRRH